MKDRPRFDNWEAFCEELPLSDDETEAWNEARTVLLVDEVLKEHVIEATMAEHIEASLLGMCLIDPDAYRRVKPYVSAEGFFFDRAHGLVWQAIAPICDWQRVARSFLDWTGER